MSGSRAARWLFWTGSAGCVTLFTINHGFAIHSVSGPSMHPALNPQLHTSTGRDLVLVDKRIPYSKMERGIIVAFW